jgi:pectate lyase
MDLVTAAVAGSAKKIVLIQGTITGNVAIRVGANTSVIGKSGSCTCPKFGATAMILRLFYSACWCWTPSTGLLLTFLPKLSLTLAKVLDVSNVIIRNVKISKVLAAAGTYTHILAYSWPKPEIKTGDALGVQNAHQVWIDHVDLSSDRGMSVSPGRENKANSLSTFRPRQGMRPNDFPAHLANIFLGLVSHCHFPADLPS